MSRTSHVHASVDAYFRGMNGKLHGKVAVITGGNSGIGLASAQLFAREGASVVVFGREENVLHHDGLIGVRGDVTSETDLQRLFETVRARFGRIDVLFANAGLSKSAALGDVTRDFFDQLFDVNVKGTFFTVQHALPLLARGASVIVTTSNTNSVGYPNLSVYGGTKAATRAFVRSWAAELVGRDVRVNALSPGPIATSLLTKEVDTVTREAMFAGISSIIPMKRMGLAEEVARSALFLASNDSSFMTAAELVVDGGTSEL